MCRRVNESPYQDDTPLVPTVNVLFSGFRAIQNHYREMNHTENVKPEALQYLPSSLVGFTAGIRGVCLSDRSRSLSHKEPEYVKIYSWNMGCVLDNTVGTWGVDWK